MRRTVHLACMGTLLSTTMLSTAYAASGGASTKTVSSYGVGIQHVAYWTKALTSRIGIAFNTIDQESQNLGGRDSRLTNSISNPQKENDTSDSGMTYNLGLTYMPTEDFAISA